MTTEKEIRHGVLILTHARPSRVITMNTLRKAGYTGPVKLIVDTDDVTGPQYVNKFGKENVIFFDKSEILKEFDLGDNRTDTRTIVFARNAAQKIARDLGWTHHVQLDDDYSQFTYLFNSEGYFKRTNVREMDKVILALCRFLDSMPSSVKTIAVVQTGDLMGGAASETLSSINIAGVTGLRRKSMNFYVFAADNPVTHIGRFNDDVNTYVMGGQRGDLFFSLNVICLAQDECMKTPGGVSDAYRDMGTYCKSFYTVMMAPSAAKVSILRDKNIWRIHHKIQWKNTCSAILHESHRKL